MNKNIIVLTVIYLFTIQLHSQSVRLHPEHEHYFIWLHFIPKTINSIAEVTYIYKGLKSVKEHGSSPWEEFICNFSTYKNGGKFYFKYWLPKGAKYFVMAKVDTIHITGPASGRML